MFASTLRTGYTGHPSDLVSVWHGSRSPGGVPVMLCHGFLGTALQWYDSAVTGTTASAIAAADLTAVGASLGQNHWGNDDFLDAFDDALAWSAANYGTRTDQVAIWGTSMGGEALNWVWRNPTKIAAVALTIPSVALQAIWEQDPIGLATFIEDAYGGEAGLVAALPTHDPSHPDNVALLVPLADKIRIWYSTDDNVIDAADVEAFAAATGITAVSIGAVGHSQGASQQQVMDWLIPRVWWV